MRPPGTTWKLSGDTIRTSGWPLNSTRVVVATTLSRPAAVSAVTVTQPSAGTGPAVVSNTDASPNAFVRACSSIPPPLVRKRTTVPSATGLDAASYTYAVIRFLSPKRTPPGMFSFSTARLKWLPSAYRPATAGGTVPPPPSSPSVPRALAVKVGGIPSNPSTVTATRLTPGTGPSRSRISARPSAPVIFSLTVVLAPAVSTSTPPPAITENCTSTPATGRPPRPTAWTVSGCSSDAPGSAA